MEYKGRTYSGYWALVVSLRRAFGDGIAIWNAKGLSRMSEVELGYLLRGMGQAPHLEKRVDVLREMGSILQERYAGDFTTGHQGSWRERPGVGGSDGRGFPLPS